MYDRFGSRPNAECGKIIIGRIGSRADSSRMRLPQDGTMNE